MPLRLLIIEGNTREDRERHARWRGLTPSAAYAEVVAGLVPGAAIDLCFPADEGSNACPDKAGLSAYDGIFITGSSLNIYDMTAPILRQIALVREGFGSGTPMFGSCWGLQLLTVAAGGSVRRNPKGLEFGFARHIRANAAGQGHALLEGRPASFDAPAVHYDEVETLPENATLLASNGMSTVQAVEIRRGDTVAWGVQYHPEFTLSEVADIGREIGVRLVGDGIFRGDDERIRWCDELTALENEPDSPPLRWRFGLDDEVVEPVRRRSELRNFLTHLVEPTRSRRARA